MKKLNAILGMIAAFCLIATSAFAVDIEDGSTKYLSAKTINFGAGLDVTKSGGVHTVSAAAAAVTSGTIDGATIGGTTPGAGSFSALTAGGLAGAANTWKYVSNGIEAEGATADAFETTVSFADPTADQTVTVPATAGAAGTVKLNGATVVITPGTTPTLTVPLAVDFVATDTITTDNQDQTITFSSGGTVGQRCMVVFQTDSGGSNDEVITFHTTLANTTGTLTLANLTANRYTITFVSDGTVWNEQCRTGAQT